MTEVQTTPKKKASKPVKKEVMDIAIESKAKKEKLTIEVAAEVTPAIKSTLVKKKSTSKANLERIYATGRRKEATARVWLSRGTGKITVNKKDITQYFARPVLRMIVNQPFAATETVGQYDVMCTIKGSGLSGQAGALRLGISRALNTSSEELHTVLRHGGFLTRDSRKVERKKYGHKKARKSFQFSKR